MTGPAKEASSAASSWRAVTLQRLYCFFVIEVDSRYMHILGVTANPGTHTPDCEKLVLPTAYWQVGAKCTSDVPATE